MKRWIPTVLKNYVRHNGFYLSTHISFCAILSLVPLILISVSVIGFLLGSSHIVYQQLLQAITSILPQGKEYLIANLDEIVGQRHSFGALGLVILLFITTILFGAIERGLDIVFEATKSRNFFHSRLLAIALIGAVSMFFFLPAAIDIFARSMARFGFLFPLGDILRGKLFFFLVSFLAFVLFVFVIPNHNIRLRYAMVGGVFFGLGILLAKQIFRWYILKSFAQYNLIYGSLTALVLLLLWIFYVSNILLLSAEIVAYLQVSNHPSKHS